MAGCQILKNGSALDCAKILHTFQKTGFCLDQDSLVEGSEDKSSSDKLRCLFNQILSGILKEDAGTIGCIRPSPVMVGDGQPVDLFKLFWFVRKKGGYDSVSKNKFWAFVLEECGLDAGVTASVKLIYFKYLYKLDLWLNTVCKEGNLYGVGGEIGDNMIQLKSNEREKNMVEERKLLVCAGKNDCMVNRIREEIPNGDDDEKNANGDDDEKNANGDDDEKNANGDDDEKNANCDDELILRRRESLSGMLNWITGVAKQTTDETDGKFRTQVLVVREARLLKRKASPYLLHSLFQKKQKMHPSMYEGTGINREGLRCNRKPSSLLSSALTLCSQSNSPNKTPLLTPKKPETLKSPTVNSLLEQKPKKIYVGCQFQADVPVWDGAILKSDSKWLGTRIWPLETLRSQNGRDRVGKGRGESCFCQFPGSVNCVQFHVAEKRMKLRSELGAAVFHGWRFDRMGEEVSLSWTPEEEKEFKNVVSLNPPSLNISFWEEIFKRFPMRKREDLVRYYFNVFVIRRRRYQNRMCPANIDSDDDESMFDSLNGGFGVEDVRVSEPMDVCAQNEQCFELD